MNGNQVGIVLIFLGMSLFAFQDILIKSMAPTASLMQILFLGELLVLYYFLCSFTLPIDSSTFRHHILLWQLRGVSYFRRIYIILCFVDPYTASRSDKFIFYLAFIYDNFF